MRKVALFTAVLLILLSLFAGCGKEIEKSYSQIAEGANFGSNVDGYQKKLPYNYCLNVDLSEKARLFMVPENLRNIPYFENSVYNTPAILKGRFTKGYYDDEKLILCEELSEGNYEYIIFDFATQKIERTSDKNRVNKLAKTEWFELCNTIEEGLQ